MKRPGTPYLPHQTTDPDYGTITAVAMTLKDVHDSRSYPEQLEYVHINVMPLKSTAADSAYDYPLTHRVLEELGIDFLSCLSSPMAAQKPSLSEMRSPIRNSRLKPPFGVHFRLGRADRQPPSNGFLYAVSVGGWVVL